MIPANERTRRTHEEAPRAPSISGLTSLDSSSIRMTFKLNYVTVLRVLGTLMGESWGSFHVQSIDVKSRGCVMKMGALT